MVDVGSPSCLTLDTVFNAGTVVAQNQRPEIVVHLGQIKSNAVVIVEGSPDGLVYQVVGFLNGVPPGVNPRCQATIEGGRALLDIKAENEAGGGCNHVPNLVHLRFSRSGATVSSGSVEVDAVEASECSFKPYGAPAPACGANTQATWPATG